MAGDHARIKRDIWSSDEFLDLSGGAQHLYFILWTHPSRSFCGSLEWHPGKLASLAADLTPESVVRDGIELAQNLFIAVDLDTEEALIRSWIKHDGLYRQPNMAVAMSTARAALTSRGLRGIVVNEVSKLRTAEPTLPAWKRDQVANLLDQKAVDPADFLAGSPWAKGSVNPFGNPFGNPSRKGSVNPSVTPFDNPSVNPKPNPSVNPSVSPSPSPTPNSNSLNSGYVSTEGNDASAIEPPPAHCPQHIDEPTTAPCRACGDARRTREAWDREREIETTLALSAENRRIAELKAEAIDECSMCDERGYVGVHPCDHDPDRFARARRGIDLVNETLAQKRAEAAAKESGDEQL